MTKTIDKLSDRQYSIDYGANSVSKAAQKAIIGASAGESFLPTVKFVVGKSWISLTSWGSFGTGDASEIGSGEIDRLEFGSGDERIRFYAKDNDGAPQRGDLLEIDFVLYKKPVSNRFVWDVDKSADIILIQQPLFSEMDASDLPTSGIVDRDNSGGWDKDGKKIVNIPDELQGSIAIFDNSGWQALKIGNIERIKATDSAGLESWGNLEYYEKENTITAVLPQAFLDAAKYPVIVDPTLGYTTLGGTGSASQNIRAKLATATEDGTITSIFAGMSDITSGDGYQTAVYSSIGASDDTGPLEGNGAEKTAAVSSTPQWIEWSGLSIDITDGVEYAFAAHLEDTGELYNDWVGGTESRWVYKTYVTNTWDDPETIDYATGWAYSVYVEYTPKVIIDSFENVAGEAAYHYPGKPNLTIAGASFGSSQGSGSVRLGDASTFSGSSTFDTLSIDSWADTSIQVDIPASLTNDLGTLYLYVTNDDGVTNVNGLECSILREFGFRFQGGDLSATSVNWVRVNGGTTPDLANMKLHSIEIYCDDDHSSQVRVCLYEGGSLSDGPDAGTPATLIEDLGLTAGSGEDQWIEVLSSTNPDISADETFWIGVKGNDTGFKPATDTDWPTGSEFEDTEGRWNSEAVSDNEATAWPSTWPTDNSGSFASVWYSFKLVYTVAGDIEAAGTADAQSSAVGVLTGTMEAAGEADAQSTSVGAMEGEIDAIGQADAQSTAVGTLEGTIEAAGSAAAQSGAEGTATGDIEATGQADAQTTAEGTAAGDMEASGAAASQSSAVGTLEGTMDALGSSDAQSGAEGTLEGEVSAAGASDAQTTAVGAMTGEIESDGSAAAQSGAIGTMEGDVEAAGQADAVSTAVGTATVEEAGAIEAAGTADAQSGAEGTLSGDVAAAGSSDAQSGAQGVLIGDVDASGQADAQSGAIATASMSVSAAGSAAAQSGAVGAFSGTMEAAGQADAQSTAAGTLEGDIAAAGQADAQSTAEGTATVELEVRYAAGRADAQSGASGTMAGVIEAAGSSHAQSGAEGTVDSPSGLLGTLRALLPRTPLWSIVEDKALRWLVQVIGKRFAPVREYFDEIWLDAFPETTRELPAWEAVQGVRESGLSEADRRERFAGWLRAQGGQSPSYIQDVLQAAGYPVYVFDWWSDDTPTARNPVESLGYIELGCGDDEMECGNDIAECGATKGGFGYALVNKLYRVGPNYTTGCGEDHMECGDHSAECGDYDGLEFVRIEYEIPTDPVYWPFFMYIGGAGFTQVDIPASRREHFEDLILSICPEHLWIGMLVRYVSGYIYEDASGDYLLEDASGDYLYEVAP